MRYEFASVAAMPAGLWRWPHISPAVEWADRMSGQIVIETTFLDAFEQLRARYGRPIIIASGYRTPEHNTIVSATNSSDGAHTLALAFDATVYGQHAFELLHHALGLGFFSGIGIAQTGSPASRFLHFDAAPDRPAATRPRVWSY